tara:strand:+ start:1396 stop:2256 length:861 start_codon:yes stop_codon:yes gene_type:complete
MEVKKVADNVVTLKTTWENGNAIRFLLCSDQHFDSKYCDRELLTSHFDEAKEKKIPILMCGDWWDAMQMASDRRSAKSSLKPAYMDAYLDDLVDETVEFLEPYAPFIGMWAWGNHESSILKHAETKLITRAIELLRLKTGFRICEMPYRGYVIVHMNYKGGGNATSFKIAYTHGEGGSAPVTRGVIKTNRRAVFHPDANVVVGGHIHEGWSVSVPRFRVSNRGVVYQDEQLHVQLPTYKTAIINEGWEAERGFGPAAKGGVWLNAKMKRVDRNATKVPILTTERAV